MTHFEIANELLKNSKNDYIKEFITNYILYKTEYEYGNDMCFHNCISYIEKENFDITGWELSEVPISYVFCFYNEHKKAAFDLMVSNTGEVIPQYLDSDQNDQQAKTIQEAINNFIVEPESNPIKIENIKCPTCNKQKHVIAPKKLPYFYCKECGVVFKKE